MTVKKRPSVPPSDGPLAFRPRARLLRILGEELISDEVIAVVELVKNAYDADAHEVNVRLDTSGTIEIKDDGHGMSRADLSGPWMEPGGSQKRARKTSPGGRALLGKKGVGRFAADKLASRLQMRTKRAGTKTEFAATFDWGQFDENDKYLDEIAFEISETASLDRNVHGTTLLLSPLRRRWDDEDLLKRLRLELLRLQSPFISQEDDPFHVVLTIDRNVEDLSGIEEKLLQTALWKVSAQLDEENQRIEMTVNGRKRSPVPVDGGKVTCGPLAINLYAWKRDPDALEPLRERLNLGTAAARDLLDRWCGVAVYRDRFRVFPYGQSGDDWLELDRRRINVPGGRLSNNQLIGAVHLSEKTNPRLVDQTNREGLIENPAYLDMRKIVLQIVQSMANDLRKDQDEEPEAKRGAPKGRRHLFQRDALAALQTTVRDASAELDRKQLLSLTTKAFEESEKAEKAVFSEIARYNRLLSLGIVAARMVHEVRQQTELLRRSADTAGLLLRSKPPAIPQVEAKLDAIDGAAGIINREVKRVSPFIRARRKLEPIDVMDSVKEVLDQEAYRIERMGVACDVQGPRGKLIVRADAGELFQAIHNLVDNSLHWLKERRSPKISVTGNVRQGVVGLLIQDNGPGIPEEHVEDVFEPFWTLKADGSGLGLPIAGEIVQDYGGSIQLVDNHPGKGCGFRIQIPLLGD